MSTNNAISICDLHKKYGSQQVLNGLNLDVPYGKTLIILGRSGVGKSVLLRHILGIEPPDSGTICIDGQNLATISKSAKRALLARMGMLFQSSALFDSMTVGMNVGFYLLYHGDPETGKRLKQREIDAHVREALKKVDLEGFEQMMPSELSGGQKRRAALARLLVYRPKIILYDEPTTGLDPITAMHINQLIRATQNELQATAICVTHDLHSALAIGDIFALHENGVIEYRAEKKEFMNANNPVIKQFFINSHVEDTINNAHI